MDPIKRDSHDLTYAGPTPDIGDLSCERRDGAIYSHWRPSAEELEELKAGGVIELGIFTEPIPPVSIGVVKDEAAEGNV